MTKETEIKTGSRPKRSIGGTRKNSISSSSLTDIPQHIADHFKAQGYKTRWARVVGANKMQDHERITYWMDRGGLIVTAKELKDIDPDFLKPLKRFEYFEEFADEEETAKRGQLTGVQRGELILMKIPLEYVEAKQQEMRDIEAQQLQSAERKYRETTQGSYKNAVKVEGIPTNTSRKFFEE